MNKDDNPLVSAIITTYNRDSKTVEEAILSVENQTYQNIEIIVIDDNPINSDNSSNLLVMCSKHSNVKYIKQNGNKGACAARNLGIVNSRGAFVGCLDDDDRWEPKKIEMQLECFSCPEIGLVYCCGLQKDALSGDTIPYYNKTSFKESITHDDLLEHDYIGSTSNPLVRRECFDSVGLFWEKQPARQDYEMWLRISTKYKVVGINEPLFIKIMHSGEQISRNKKKAHDGFKNIYLRYKKEYKKNLRAKLKLQKLIYKNRSGNIVSDIPIYIDFLFSSMWYVLKYRWMKFDKRAAGDHFKE